MRDQSDQARQALQFANRVRAELASERRRIVAAEPAEAARLVAAALRDPHPPLDAIPVERLLIAQRGVGPVVVRRLLRHAGLSSGTTSVRDMTGRQREVLAHAVLLPSSSRRLLAPAGPCLGCNQLRAQLETQRAEMGWQRDVLVRIARGPLDGASSANLWAEHWVRYGRWARDCARQALHKGSEAAS